MAKLFNRAKMTTSTTGTGTITLGSASTGFQTFADAGVSDGDVVQYVIEEGANFEIGTGTYTASGTTLSRTPSESSNSDAAITLAGAAQVAITAVASQIGGGDRDLSFDDNAKAKFGAGDDLQIYHDGSASRIVDAGTGNLIISATDFQVNDSGNNEVLMRAIDNGGVELRYSNSVKLQTTSTGIDISGSITADGLTVDGDGTFSGLIKGAENYSYLATIDEGIYLGATNQNAGNSTHAVGWKANVTGAGNTAYYIQSGVASSYGANFPDTFTNRLKVAAGGDISFYEDTGTTAKFFWDASAESLGIGTGSPQAELHLSTASTPEIRLTDTTNSVEANFFATDSVGTIGTKSNHAFLLNTNNLERMRITSTGDVRIGTGSSSNGVKTLIQGTQTGGAPATSGTTQTYGLLRLQGTTFTAALDMGTNGGNYAWIQSTDKTNLGTNYSLVLNPNGGRVGINTDNPTQALEVRGSVRIGAGAQDTSDMLLKGNTGPAVAVGGSTEAAIITTTGVSGGAFHVGIEVPSNDSNDGFYVATDANNDGVVDTLAMKINAAGNVGIGTAITSLFNGVGGQARLAVCGSDTSTNVANNSSASIAIINTDTTANNTAALHFARADTDDTPNYAGASIVAQFPDTQVTGQYPKGNLHFLTSTSANTAPSEKMRIEAGGKVMMNTTGLLSNHSSGRVQIDGGSQHGLSVITGASSGFAAISCGRNTSGAAVEFHYTNSTNVGKINIDSTSTTYVTTSDRRLKTDIQPITDGTEKLMAMNPVTHKWKAEPDADAVHGFIAQEMQEIVPEAVSGDPDGDEMMAMDYGRITPVLVAALQDAHKKIAELSSEIQALKEA